MATFRAASGLSRSIRSQIRSKSWAASGDQRISIKSRTQESFQALAGLFVRQELAAIQGFFTALHGLDEAGFLLEILRQDLFDKIVRTPALSCGGLRKLLNSFFLGYATLPRFGGLRLGQAPFHFRVVRIDGEDALILGDGIVVTARPGQRDGQIVARVDEIGV
jgi:hypothetical protein